MSVEEISFEIILHGGNARTLSTEAIQEAKSGNFDLAEQKLKEANEEMTKAHRPQTDLIQGEMRGETTEIRLLLIHAQDHLMNAMTVFDLAQELIDIHKKISLKETNH
ncbi:lichenan-specific phosphotransferase enzyme IIA component [Paraliobacillus ryukyuensis]|uniref:PTS system lichenan oligosaccharide-specific IIA component (Lac family) n=1 Tax=Paraliobacillus ryukyuensis TaxID=200904 RepID=A0A366EEH9_9BACI|nr:PTS lactose/cellobiose transporter subunit IIA [Paraliobacillus ryukyuensis]RBO99874.1 PTS system lichenan oligosaccharide-specific IIA component (Lac family) [Paraliobacillus ryukyuensis]